jgi:hypothetical protein
VEDINGGVDRFELDRVDWEDVEMVFWPRCAEQDGLTEPDLVLASNRWVIVVEVKLGSGFGKNQPWREYELGQQIAKNRAVYYVIVSRAKLDGVTVHGLPRKVKRNRR